MAAGPELVAYEADGKRERILSLEDDAFRTAPANGDHGELFIAGRKNFTAFLEGVSILMLTIRNSQIKQMASSCPNRPMIQPCANTKDWIGSVW